jgi:hypothetical protein
MHRHLQIAMRGRSVTDVQEDRPAGDEHVSRRLYNNSSLALRHPHEPEKMLLGLMHETDLERYFVGIPQKLSPGISDSEN